MIFENVVIKKSHGHYYKANLTVSNGIIEEIAYLNDNPNDIENAEFYVTPGFVNSHLHPNLLLDRRKLDELGIDELLDQMHDNYKKTEDDRLCQALFVLMDAVKAGATSIYSVANKPASVIKAYKMLGIKGAVTCFFNDQWEGFGNSPSLTHINDIEQHFKAFHDQKTADVDIHIGSSSIQGASNDLLKLLDHLAEKFDTKVNIHVSEGDTHVKSCKKSRCMTPIRLLAHLGVLNHRWNLIHTVHVDDEEIELIAKSGATVIHSPVSNAKTGVGIAPIVKMMKMGVKIGLGTDACSNNNTNNILNEAYFASLLHCANQMMPNVVSLDTLFRWMTTNGYDIIGRKQRGVIDIGQPADLAFWSLNSNAFVPKAFCKFDNALIWNAPDLKPHTIFVNGQAIVQNYTLVSTSEEKISQNANSLGYRIQEYLNSLHPALA